LGPMQGLAKVWAKNEARESHFMLLGVWENVQEWTSTLPEEFPLWELESQWTFEFSKKHLGVKTHWIEKFIILLESYWNVDV
jgi:hypothetical protein